MLTLATLYPPECLAQRLRHRAPIHLQAMRTALWRMQWVWDAAALISVFVFAYMLLCIVQGSRLGTFDLRPKDSDPDSKRSDHDADGGERRSRR